jgi:murein L,D-transpeptidase YafK
MTKLMFPILTSLILSTGSAGAARPGHVLHVFKSDHKMVLEVADRAVKTFTVSLGRRPIGDKLRQGDYRTPEGEFYVAWKNPTSSFHRFLGLSYPMPRHAQRAVDEGAISSSQLDAIERAAKTRTAPPQDTPLGGFVGIHGGGTGSDWTFGCIAVTDAEIEWLFSEMRVGDRIVVHP